jgi:hypothetical protein
MKRLVILSFILFYFVAKPQAQNLIQNGSFENYTNIDCTYGGFTNNFPPNNHVVDYWYGLSSPDYFNTVCPSSTSVYNPFANIFGNISPHGGNAYSGFLTYLKGGEIKEYIYQHLSQPLQAGEIYCLNFFVSRVDKAHYSVANIGAYFSNTIPTLYNGYYVNKTPQIINQNGFVTDTISWSQIQGCFTATGGEQYITIGKFNTTGSDTLNSGTNNPIPFNPDMSYYYIDDITLIDQSTVGISELDTGNSFEIYPNPNNGVMQLNYNITKVAELLITDITGRVVNSYSLDETKKSIAVNEQSLHAGIYFYTIKQSNRILKQDKFFIIK